MRMNETICALGALYAVAYHGSASDDARGFDDRVRSGATEAAGSATHRPIENKTNSIIQPSKQSVILLA
jgi:hypothetical protein